MSSKKKTSPKTHAHAPTKRAAAAPASKKRTAAPAAPARETTTPVQRAIISAAALGRKVESLVRQTAHWTPALEDLLRNARTAAAKLNDAYESLGEDFDPPTRARTGGLRPGDKVQITEKAREKYTDVLESDELTGVHVVVKVADGKVRVTTEEGVTLLFPRGHVGPVVSDDSDEEESEDEDEESEDAADDDSDEESDGDDADYGDDDDDNSDEE